MLTARDYEKLLEFQSRICRFEDDMRLTILQTMQELYANYPMAFFLATDDEQYVNPVTVNISAATMQAYNKYYYKTDIFHTSCISKALLRKSIVHITDIMSTGEFEKTEFYSDNLKKMGVYDEIALQLHDQNRLLGVIGIMKPKCYGNFTETELRCAEFVRRSVVPCLKEYLDRLNIRHESDLILGCTKEAPIGLIIFDSNLKAIQYNQAAVRFVNDIFGADYDDRLNEEILKRLSEKLYFKGGSSAASLQTSIQNYSFRIVPFAVPHFIRGFDTFYTVYILKHEHSKTVDFDRLKTAYNLTARECEIVSMLSRGCSNKKIADELYVSPHTVKTHMQNIFRKMNSVSRTDVLHKIMPSE